MGVDPIRVGRFTVYTRLADSVGALDPSPLVQRNFCRVSRIGGSVESVRPKVAERAVAGGVVALTSEQPEVSVHIAPGCGKPPSAGDVGSGRNALDTVVSGCTGCPLGSAHPGPLFSSYGIEFPKVIEAVCATGESTKHPEIPSVVDPSNGCLTARRLIGGGCRALGAVGASRITRNGTTYPRPLPAAILPEVVQQEIRAVGSRRVAAKSSEQPKIAGSIEPGTRSPASTWQVEGRGHVLRAIDTRLVPAAGMERPSFRCNVEFPQIVQER